ncbi:unnamed protein product [Rhizophagus irregularis]|uniref:Uncharacterized protein n=1 Tax=Rhizophagus irregularis TaxID=588596 RepID=A0A916EGM0_9GLOM|nr:unnamed protein product [Rhizophagus irregularis]CAB5217253.1 unnamed protein product [Rhizophagus irregularis]CAB5380891.1 unnamed protein product [Rhizophagus irregularis]
MVIILLLLRVSLKRRMETAGMKSVPRIGGVTEISRIPNSRPDRSFEKEMTNGTSTSINFYGDSQNNKDLIMSSATKRKCVTNIHTIINEKYHKNQRGLSYIGREEELTPPCGTMVANSWNSFKIEIGLRYFLSSYHESSGIKLFIQ